MIFKSDTFSFEILDVLEINQKNVNSYNTGRNFDALSFRYKSLSTLSTEKTHLSVNDNSISYVPAQVDYTRISDYDNLIVIHFNSINYFSKDIQCYYSKKPEALLSLFKKALLYWNKKEPGYKYRCSAILYEIFTICYCENSLETSVNSKISNSIKYINENYKSPSISVKQAALQSYISEVYFREIFKKEFGICPKKYIIDLKIKYAISMISTGYYSLSEIAVLCGFSDYKYFSTEFKRITGKSPSKYCYK